MCHEPARTNNWIHQHFTSKRSVINGCRHEEKLNLESNISLGASQQGTLCGNAQDPRTQSISISICTGTLEGKHSTLPIASFPIFNILWTMEIA